jgi:predicted restriction endonuclease
LYLVAAGLDSVGYLGNLKPETVNSGDSEGLEDLVKASFKYSPFEINEQSIRDAISEIDERGSQQKSKRKKKSTSYARNPILSALIKELRGDKCQICGTEFGLQGRYFCETHHIVPLSVGGLDRSDNIIVVCPNHHKILDNSEIVVVERKEGSIVFKLGDSVYDIHLN